ncbi:hypothetical protein DXG01_004018, partial [Tephrocybe rancida]
MKVTITTSLLSFVAIAAFASPTPATSHKRQDPFGYASGSKKSVANLKEKIQTVVWILFENRSFDNLLGGITGHGFDNPVENGPFCNPVNVSQPGGTKFCSFFQDFDSVADDPNHS